MSSISRTISSRIFWSVTSPSFSFSAALSLPLFTSRPIVALNTVVTIEDMIDRQLKTYSNEITLKWLGGSVPGFIWLPWTFQGECVSACSLVTSSTINSPISGRRVREGCHKKQRMSTERFRLFRACRVHDVINSFFISRWTIFLCVSCKDRFRQQIRFSIRNYFIQHMKNVMKCKVNTGQ